MVVSTQNVSSLNVCTSDKIKSVVNWMFVQGVLHSSMNQTWTPAVVHACLPYQLRQFQTSCCTRDIDQAAKYIGAGAATVGVAGSGEWRSTLGFMAALT